MKEMRTLFILVIFVVVSISLNAQNSDNQKLNVWLQDNSVKQFSTKDIKKIKFADGNMNIVLKDGTSEGVNIDDVFYVNGQSLPETQLEVDLGLSVKWASKNIGANKITDSGDSFAWGETKSKTSFWSDNYIWQYATSWPKNMIELPKDNDAAIKNWGDNWRMPTQDEMNELVDECTWKWATVEGTLGYIVTGPNGNSIFLPKGGYWTSTCSYASSGYNIIRGCYLYMHTSDLSMNHYKGWTSENDGYRGQLIRPVRD